MKHDYALLNSFLHNWRSLLGIVLIAGLGITGLLAQNKEPQIQRSFAGESFSDFVKETEADHPIRYYFVQSWIDTITVVQSSAPAPLSEILSSTFARTDFSFLIEGQDIIITPYQISRDLTTFTAPPPRQVSSTPAFSVPQTSAPTAEETIETIEIGTGSDDGQDKVTLTGTIRDMNSTEPIIGASVFVEELHAGILTDGYGFYSLTLPRGLHMVAFRSYGMEEQKKRIMLKGSGKLNVEMEGVIRQLDEVIIEAERDQNISGAQMGVAKLDISTLKSMPSFMGEIDVIKSALLLPGIQSVGEGASGFNVRGGGADQNLILLNQAPIYNPSHVFGFFSVFNPELIKSFDLYKSGIPAQYGGRLSSVLDIAMKDGNKKQLAGSGGISPVTGRLTLEGPLLNNENSFIMGARSTYSDWILRRLPNPDIRNSSGGFYDFNAKVNFKLGENDRLDISGYYSRDYFRFNQDTTYAYSNLNASASWKHLFNDRLVGVFSGVFSSYNYRIGSQDTLPLSAFQIDYDIRHKELKADFTYIPDPRHQIKFGANDILYGINPGSKEPIGRESIVFPQILEKEQALEGSIYASDEYDVSNRFKISAGFRYSYYIFWGPQTIFDYPADRPRQEVHISDSTTYGSGEPIRFYHGPEWRFSSRYSISDKSSVKFSVARMRQYMHMLSNTTSISPTDTWKLSDPHLRPQVGDQVSLGYYRNFRQNSIETSVEIYYKKIRNILEFKGGAQLLLNPYVETDLINARGRAFGVEFLIKKERGKLNGWISYTLSRTEVLAAGNFADEIINGGDWFPANYDQPHNLSVVGNIKFSRRFSISSNFAYNTGRPITYPVGQYSFANGVRLNYSQRNQFRIPDYYRWDLSLNIEGNHKIKKLAHSSWALTIFNVLGRKNVYSIFFEGNANGVQGYKLSVFGQTFTTATYNFRF